MNRRVTAADRYVIPGQSGSVVDIYMYVERRNHDNSDEIQYLIEPTENLVDVEEQRSCIKLFIYLLGAI